MYAIVLGCGSTGVKISEWLMASGTEVTVIEKDPERQRFVDNLFGSVVTLGDGTVVETLEAAGAQRADLFIATLGSDEDNMLACQIAKHNFKVDTTLALSGNPDKAHLLGILGIDIVVDLTDLITEEIQRIVAPMFVEDL